MVMISQREARRLQKRVRLLEESIMAQRRAWSHEFIGGVQIAAVQYTSVNDTVPTAIRTARKLSHAVVVTCDDSGSVRFQALPLVKQV